MGRVTARVEYAADGVTPVYTRTAAYNADSQLIHDTIVTAGSTTDSYYYYNQGGTNYLGVVITVTRPITPK
jgi:hypothetical protein